MTDLLQAVLVPEAAQMLNASMHQIGLSAIRQVDIPSRRSALTARGRRISVEVQYLRAAMWSNTSFPSLTSTTNLRSAFSSFCKSHRLIGQRHNRTWRIQAALQPSPPLMARGGFTILWDSASSTTSFSSSSQWGNDTHRFMDTYYMLTSTQLPSRLHLGSSRIPLVQRTILQRQ